MAQSEARSPLLLWITRACLLVALIVGWLGAGLFYGERIAVIEERLKQKDDLIGDFREKTQSETPDEVAKKMKELEDQITKLTKRELKALENHVEENDDGTYTIKRLVEVVSFTFPALLHIEAEADGLIDMNVQGSPPGVMISGNGRINPQSMYWNIKSPFGKYLVTVHAEKPNFILRYRFY